MGTDCHAIIRVCFPFGNTSSSVQTNNLGVALSERTVTLLSRPTAGLDVDCSLCLGLAWSIVGVGLGVSCYYIHT